MSGGPHDPAPLEAARLELGLSVSQLWMRCFALGGVLAPLDLTASLEGRRKFGARDFDVVVHALNESYVELGRNHPLAYADQLVRR